MTSVAVPILAAGLGALVARASERKKTAQITRKLDLVQKLVDTLRQDVKKETSKSKQLSSLSSALQKQVDELKKNETFLLLSAELGQIFVEISETTALITQVETALALSSSDQETIELLTEYERLLSLLIDLVGQALELQAQIENSGRNATRNDGIVDVLAKLSQIKQQTEQLLLLVNTTIQSWPDKQETDKQEALGQIQQTSQTVLSQANDAKESYDSTLTSTGGLYEAIALLQTQNKTLETALQVEAAKAAQLTQQLADKTTEASQLQTQIGLITDELGLVKAQLAQKILDIQALGQQKEQLEEQIGDLQGDKEALSKQVDDLESQLDTKRSELAQIEQDKARVQQLLDEANTSIESLQESKGLLETTLESTAKQLSEANENLETAQEKLTSAQLTIGTLEQTIESKNTSISTLETQLSSTQTALENAQGDLTQTQADLVAAQGTISTLNGEIDQLNLDIEVFVGQIEQLEIDKGAVSESLATALAQKEAISKQLDEANGLVATLQTQVQTLTGTISTLETDLQTAQTDLQEAQTSLQDSEAALLRAQEDLSAAQESIDTITQDKELAEQERQRVESQLIEANERINQLIIDKGALEEDLFTSSEQIKSLQQQIAALEQTIRDREGQITSKDDTITQLNGQISTLQERVQTLTEERDELQQLLDDALANPNCPACPDVATELTQAEKDYVNQELDAKLETLTLDKSIFEDYDWDETIAQDFERQLDKFLGLDNAEYAQTFVKDGKVLSITQALVQLNESTALATQLSNTASQQAAEVPALVEAIDGASQSIDTIRNTANVAIQQTIAKVDIVDAKVNGAKQHFDQTIDQAYTILAPSRSQFLNLTDRLFAGEFGVLPYGRPSLSRAQLRLDPITAPSMTWAARSVPVSSNAAQLAASLGQFIENGDSYESVLGYLLRNGVFSSQQLTDKLKSQDVFFQAWYELTSMTKVPFTDQLLTDRTNLVTLSFPCETRNALGEFVSVSFSVDYVLNGVRTLDAQKYNVKSDQSVESVSLEIVVPSLNLGGQTFEAILRSSFDESACQSVLDTKMSNQGVPVDLAKWAKVVRRAANILSRSAFGAYPKFVRTKPIVRSEILNGERTVYVPLYVSHTDDEYLKSSIYPASQGPVLLDGTTLPKPLQVTGSYSVSSLDALPDDTLRYLFVSNQQGTRPQSWNDQESCAEVPLMLRVVGSTDETQYTYVEQIDGVDVTHRVIARLYPLVDPNQGSIGLAELGMKREQIWDMLRRVTFPRLVQLAPTVMFTVQQVSQYDVRALPGVALDDEKKQEVRENLELIINHVKADNLSATIQDLVVALDLALASTPLTVAAQTQAVIVAKAVLQAIYSNQSAIIPTQVYSNDFFAIVFKAYELGLLTAQDVALNEETALLIAQY